MRLPFVFPNPHQQPRKLRPQRLLLAPLHHRHAGLHLLQRPREVLRDTSTHSSSFPCSCPDAPSASIASSAPNVLLSATTPASVTSTAKSAPSPRSATGSSSVHPRPPQWPAPQRHLLRPLADDLGALRGGGLVDVEQLVETAGEAHRGVGSSLRSRRRFCARRGCRGRSGGCW